MRGGLLVKVTYAILICEAVVLNLPTTPGNLHSKKSKVRGRGLPPCAHDANTIVMVMIVIIVLTIINIIMVFTQGVSDAKSIPGM